MQWVSFVLAPILWDEKGAAGICGSVSWCPAMPIYHATLRLVETSLLIPMQRSKMVTTANTWIAISISVCWYLPKNIYIKKTSIRSHEVESAIPIAYSAWWNHQEGLGSIPTGDELSISDYRNLIVSRRNLQLSKLVHLQCTVAIYVWFENVNTWNVNEDAVIFLCDSAYLAGHWQHLNLKWIWLGKKGCLPQA